MPSKEQVTKETTNSEAEKRPFTVFYVKPETPEEVHTETIMARNHEEASSLSSSRHEMNTILHVRGIGERPLFKSADTPSRTVKRNFPCARFIHGKFLQTTFSDEILLDS